MDFEYHYTAEQERFRVEVRAWLEENVPEEMTEPRDPNDLTDEQWAFARELAKKLAAKGWLSPTIPKEFGGPGMSAEYASIIAEELDRKRAIVAGGGAPPAIMVWGTEEQKERLLKPILAGEKTTTTILTEPRGGADLAGLESRAVRDGDDWIVSGVKCFITNRRQPDFMFGPLITDLEAPRHRNLGYFAIDAHSPGVTFQRMHLLSGSEQSFIFMDNVRVPGENLIGGDHQGWQVTQSVLEGLHGGQSLNVFQRDVVFKWFSEFPWKDMVDYFQETKRHGEPLGEDPLMQQLAVDCYMEGHIYTLMAKRNFWMYQNQMELSYHPVESDVHRRQHVHRNMTRVRDIMGMYTHLNIVEPWTLVRGIPDICGRNAFVSQHGDGSLNIAKVTMARRLGISRTQERAAPIAPPPPTSSS